MVKPTAPHAPSHTLALPAGHRLLWYELQRVLGQGGFGITYLARDHNLDQAVAIKEYLPVLCAARGSDASVLPLAEGLAEDFRWGLTRFIEEGRILARFDHPAVVRVHSVFESHGTAYLVMRYERGETLDARLRRDPGMSERELREILDDVMAGLEHLHQGGIIHRDIKPGNLYLREDGQALLLDFGAARQAFHAQTQTVTALVSPGYAPFEQYRSDSTMQGPWTDIYALGATAYRAITGHAPPPAIERSHRLLEGQPDVLPPLTDAGFSGYRWNLLAAIDRALAFHVRERPQSIAEWRAMFAVDEPVTHCAVTTTAPPTSPSRAAMGGSPVADEEHTTRTEPLAVPEDVTQRDPLPGITERLATTLVDRGRQPGFTGALGLLLGGLLGFAGLTLLRDQVDSAPGDFAAGQSVEVERAIQLPVAAAPSLAAGRAIPELLQAAERDLAAMRLTTPAEDNALSKYRQVLTRDPANADARKGIDRVVGRYLDLAAAAASRSDFPAAREFVAKARAVNPDDRRIAEAQSALLR